MLGIVGEAGSPVGELLTKELDLPFADEQSVVQTRFATTVLALLLGAYGWDVEASAQRAERYLTESLPDWAGDIKQFVFLGRGVGIALAQEAALKFREILATWSEGYATMEYRHGPISAINERSLVWILDDEEPSIDEQIRATGARLIRGEGDPLAELVRIHRFAEGLVELRGINPDQPPHISRSVVLAGDGRCTGAGGHCSSGARYRRDQARGRDRPPDGEVTRLATAPTRAEGGAEPVLRRALELAKQVHQEATAAGEHIEAIGVSTMGYTHETASTSPPTCRAGRSSASPRRSQSLPRPAGGDRQRRACGGAGRDGLGLAAGRQRRDLPEPRLGHLRRDHLRRPLPHRRRRRRRRGRLLALPRPARSAHGGRRHRSV